jgi:hypothetical protein
MSRGAKHDGLVKSPQCRHCEERSDAAISFFQTGTNCEIASLSEGSYRHLAKTAFQTYYEYSKY